MPPFTPNFNPYKYHGIFKEIHKIIAANVIIKYWRRCRYNPRFEMNNKIEIEQLDNICKEHNVSNLENTDNLKNFRLNLRQKDFRRELKQTKLFLKERENLLNRVKLKNRIILKPKRKYNK